MKIDNPLEWLFDGVGGAALLALIGFLYHKIRSVKDVPPALTTLSESSSVIASEKSVAVGNRSNVQTSPVVHGSHNSIFISHHTQEPRDDEEKEKNEGKESWGETLGALLITLTMLGFMGAIIWAAVHFPTVRGVLQGNRAASAIAFQYGPGISVADGTLGDQVTSCADAGVICTGEDAIPGEAIPIPELPNGNWSRIAVFVTFTEGGDSSTVLVSTSSNKVGLNYAGHRDGNVNTQIEFRMDDVKAISETQKSYWFPVDIVYRDAGARFPITVSVDEDRRHRHSATATFEIARLPLAAPQKPNAKAPILPHGANSKQITIAERVTAITEQLAYVKEGIKPEDDFEIDLGMSPSEVSLLIGEFEEEYGISIPKADALRMRTVGEAIKYIELKEGHK